MKRDMDLIRRILEYLEGQETPGLFTPPEFPNVSTHQVCYHAKLCRQAGYISGYKGTVGGDGPPRTLICRLGELTSVTRRSPDCDQRRCSGADFPGGSAPLHRR